MHVAPAITFELVRRSAFEEAGAPQCHICSFFAFVNNKIADGLSWEVEATLAPQKFSWQRNVRASSKLFSFVSLTGEWLYLCMQHLARDCWWMYLYNVREMLVFANMATVRKLTLCQMNLAFLQPQYELGGNCLSLRICLLFDSRQGQELRFSKLSKSSLGLTQAPLQWAVERARLKCSEGGDDHPPPCGTASSPNVCC
jgi:hypothetical protein